MKKRKSENGKRKTASKREQRKCICSAEREQIQDDAVGLNLRVSESMVGTRHAVSDNNSKSGLGMPSPYNPEREQIQDRKAGLKRRTENRKVTRELGVIRVIGVIRVVRVIGIIGVIRKIIQ